MHSMGFKTRLQSIPASGFRGIKRFWPYLLPAAIYLPGFFGMIPFPSAQAGYSDLLLSHYPYTLFIKQSLVESFSVPLWMPHLLGGFPFAANPLSGLWYPGGWPAMLLKLPAGLTITAVLHILWGELGTYRYLKRVGLGHPAALLGGLIFGFLPMFASHYGAGHLTMIYAVSWTPWLLAEASAAKPAWHREGGILALIFLADPRWVPYSGILWASYRVVHRKEGWFQLIIRMAKTSILALLGASPLLLPLWQFLSLSTRSALKPADVFSHSLPPAGLIGILFPKGGGNPEWELYLGGLGLTAALLGIAVTQKRKTHWFWLGGMVVSLLWTLGENFIILRPAANLPILNLLRVPPRAAFITGIGASSTAALTAQAFQENRVNTKWSRYILVGLAGTTGVTISGLGAITGELQTGMVIGLAGILLAVLLAWIGLEEKAAGNHLFLAAVVLIAADGAGSGWVNYQPRHLQSIRENYLPLLEVLTTEKESFRIYSPSADPPQFTAVTENLEFLHGVDPMQLRSFREPFLAAAGVADGGYDVSVPPYYGQSPSQAHRHADLSPELLGLFNVLYVVSSHELKGSDRFADLGEYGPVRLYKNPAFQPRAWITAEEDISIYALDDLAGIDKKSAEITSSKPNRIDVEAEGPGYLVLAEINYPGWRATVDGKTADILTAGSLFRAVLLEPGTHRVRFSFTPMLVYLGAGLGGLAIVVFIIQEREYAVHR